MPCPILSANSRRRREPHGNGGGGWKKIDTRIRGDAEGGEQNEMRRFLFNLRRACHATGTHPRRLERRTLAAFLGARNRLPLLRRNLDLARSARCAGGVAPRDGGPACHQLRSSLRAAQCAGRRCAVVAAQEAPSISRSARMIRRGFFVWRAPRGFAASASARHFCISTRARIPHADFMDKGAKRNGHPWEYFRYRRVRAVQRRVRP